MTALDSRVLVLASASPARLGLLRSAGLDPRVRVSGVDEDAVVSVHARNSPLGASLSSSEIALLLAQAKAADVVDQLTREAQTHVPPIVLGCDSVLEVGDQTHGKPGTEQIARQRWRAIRGTSATLHTGHCVVDMSTGQELAAVGSTELKFADVTDDEIDDYIASSEPLKVAGGFTLDGRGAPFVQSIVGDPSNVIGLSLPLLRRMLIGIDVAWGQVLTR